MRGAGHTSAPPGKRVLVLMRDGQHFIARFKRKEHGHVHFLDHAPVKAGEVRTLAIWRWPT